MVEMEKKDLLSHQLRHTLNFGYSCWQSSFCSLCCRYAATSVIHFLRLCETRCSHRTV